MITLCASEQGQASGSPGCRLESIGFQIAEARVLEIAASVTPNPDHELAPPAARCAIEHRTPAICDRWHQHIRAHGVLVDLSDVVRPIGRTPDDACVSTADATPR